MHAARGAARPSGPSGSGRCRRTSCRDSASAGSRRRAAIVERLARVKKTADFQTPLPLQAAVAAFLRAGADREARQARACEVEARRDAAARRSRGHLPDVSWWGGEVGSALFWLHLPEGRLGPAGGRGRGGAGRRSRAGSGLRPERGGPRQRCASRCRASSSETIERGIALLARGGPGRASRGRARRVDASAGGREEQQRRDVAEREEKTMRANDSFRVKVGLAEMLKGGVIMDVVNAEQAKIAEDAGAAAVMALERVPADIRRDGGVARMSPVSKIREIQEAVSIPVMAKCRIGHLAEARDPRGAEGRLHRRVGGPDAGRRGEPRLQARLRGPVRLRLPQPRRGAAPHRRGRGDDPDERGGGHGRHRPRRQAPARGPARDPQPDAHEQGRADGARPSGCRRRSSSSSRSPRRASSRSRTSPPAASRRRPTPRSA